MWNQVVFNILGRYVLVFCLLLKYIRTFEDDGPDWRKILAKLHNKVGDIYDSSSNKVHGAHEEAFAGKVFKYILPHDGHNDEYEAVEDHTESLPKWLSFESSKRKLHGLPTDEDIRSGIKIMFRRKHDNTVNGWVGEPKFIMLNVYNTREPFICGGLRKHSNGIQSSYAAPSTAVTTGSIIFSANISKHDGRKRVKLMRKIGKQLNQDQNSLYLEVGNRLNNDVALENGIRMAGPGDRVVNDEPGFTVTWKIKCGRDAIVDQNVMFLEQLSAQEDFSYNFKEPVLGWFVHTSEEGLPRYRRAIGAADHTPVNTPRDGTPTVSPSPSLVVSPTMIKPSKSVTIMKTAAPTAEPTTEKLTTTVATTTTTEAPTTEKLTTTTPAPRIVVQREISRIKVFAERAGEVDLSGLFVYPKPLTITFGRITTTSNDKYWIEYSKDRLYILPTTDNVGRHEFIVRGEDEDTGVYATYAMSVVVRGDSDTYNTMFNVSLQENFDEVTHSAKRKVEIVQDIAKASGEFIGGYEFLRKVSFSKGSTIMSWGLADRRYSGCKNDEVVEYVKFLSGGFTRSLVGVLDVLDVGMVENSECIPPTTAPPTTTPTTTTATTTLPTTAPATTPPATTPPATTPPATTQGATPPAATTSQTIPLPSLKTPIDPIEVFEYQAHEVVLEDSFTSPKLTIQLHHYPEKNNHVQYNDSSWIEYNNYHLYILPKKRDIGEHMFALKGTNPVTGKFQMSIFYVKVKLDNKLYNNLFNVTLQKDYGDISASAQSQVSLAKDIAHASKKDYKTLRSIQFREDGKASAIVWGLEDARYTDCRNEDVEEYMRLLQGREFRGKIGTGGVLSVGMIEKRPCVPVVIAEASRLDSNLWQRILIPVIVIVVLLLIIALILCCVYRRKRKATVQMEEDKAYLSHKKPVIFLEEFEEKPHFVSLQPLILPNEKPPTPGHHYEPRADSPPGPGSSTTVSTESEDKPLTPQSPKDSSRKGAYNAPPPYNA